MSESLSPMAPLCRALTNLLFGEFNELEQAAASFEATACFFKASTLPRSEAYLLPYSDTARSQHFLPRFANYSTLESVTLGA
jgi:hypothetical protein